MSVAQSVSDILLLATAVLTRGGTLALHINHSGFSATVAVQAFVAIRPIIPRSAFLSEWSLPRILVLYGSVLTLPTSNSSDGPQEALISANTHQALGQHPWDLRLCINVPSTEWLASPCFGPVVGSDISAGRVAET
jgi:hypothetical protein